MTRRLLLAVCAAAAALAVSARAEQRGAHGGAVVGGGSRTPHFHPPAIPMYGGRMLRVPRFAPRPGGPAAPSRRPVAPARPSGPSAPARTAGAQPPRGTQGPGRTPAYRFSSNYGGGFRAPERGQDGRPLGARPVLDVTRSAEFVHQTVADPGFAKTAQGLTESERDDGHHWHDGAGGRYSHWHDARSGRDWFGFYHGSTYFWTAYWHGHFWWHEPLSGRYLVFWNDQWWWHSPDGVYFVYVDGQYYQWLPNQNGASLIPADTSAKPEGGGEGLIVSSRPEFNYSADGTRMVQIEGEKLSAYLYDTQNRDGSKPMKFLADGVTAAAFSDTAGGAPLQIILTIQDPGGSVRTVVLDKDGNPVSSAAATAPPPAPIPFGTPGAPGFDAPQSDLPPTDAPFPDGQ
jgi:hypothetical protein